MKQRTPVYITILIILVMLYIVFYMFVQNTSFLTSLYFWGTALIAGIIAMIQSSIGDLIENTKFKNLSEEEKKAYINTKKVPYFKGLYDSAFKKQSATEEK